MHVVFVFSDDHRVERVMWTDETSGCTMVRALMSDGSTSEKKVNCKGLHDAMRRYGGAYSPMYPAEVGDLRSAFQYLGKAADLVETLPEVHVIDAKPIDSQAQ